MSEEYLARNLKEKYNVDYSTLTLKKTEMTDGCSMYFKSNGLMYIYCPITKEWWTVEDLKIRQKELDKKIV